MFLKTILFLFENQNSHFIPIIINRQLFLLPITCNLISSLEFPIFTKQLMYLILLRVFYFESNQILNQKCIDYIQISKL